MKDYYQSPGMRKKCRSEASLSSISLTGLLDVRLEIQSPTTNSVSAIFKRTLTALIKNTQPFLRACLSIENLREENLS